jgi:Fe-S cluster assembly protein SufB
MKEDLEDLGIVFKDTDSALKENEDIFREHFGKVIPPADNKFSALNSAVWSGGSFIYVPKGIKVDTPLQAYFRINSENMGQFERTLIIVDEGAHVHYVEGCTAPVYTTNSLHSAVVEIIVKDGGYCRYTTIQNWANNVFNLVTKRAVCEANATMEWIDGNIGSKLTMKYPAVILKGEGARGMTLSIALAGKGQHQDAGAKMIHLAPNTSSTIVSKSISKQGGKVTYRGIVQFGRKADGARSNIECDTLIMDNQSTSDTIPYNEIMNDNISLEHEAKVSKVSEEQLFYLMSRGISEEEATEMIVMGFIEPFTKELPMEYAVEMNRLIKFEMEGSIG